MTTTSLPLDLPSFEYVRKLVHDSSAIALEPNKGYLVESRLLPLARQRGLLSVRELVAQLKSGPFGALHRQVVEAMTTNETSFFRDLHPFEALQKDVLPPLLLARSPRKTLTIWSAACSSGQEPYTIAILLRERFPQLVDWNLQIIGSDLSQQILDRAACGNYAQHEVNRGLPASLLVKYFQKSELHWQIKPEIRKMVRFVRINLIEDWPALPVIDVIFLRNVLIYFTPDTKRQILQRVARQMSSDGALFLGGAETTLGIDAEWERVNHGKTATYRPCHTTKPGRSEASTA
jgi:chemotaxis protein methyltransferase CheR